MFICLYVEAPAKNVKNVGRTKKGVSKPAAFIFPKCSSIVINKLHGRPVEALPR